jgi:hypothetical protein
MADRSIKRQARLRPGYEDRYSGLSLTRWYDVIDDEPKAAWTKAPSGHLWIAANRRRLVEVLHFEIREWPAEPSPRGKHKGLMNQEALELLSRIERGESIFRPANLSVEAREAFQRTVAHLLELRTRGLLKLPEGRLAGC